MTTDLKSEKEVAVVVAQKLRTPLASTGNPENDKKLLQGGYQKPGYGVAAGSALDGSFAFEGKEGYYTPEGKGIFLSTVQAMRQFFERHEKKGKAIRYIVKTGIGGQHTPFQGIANGFALIDAKTGVIVGEYELGKPFEEAISQALQKLGATWEQLALIPSSKSGSTDETMRIFEQIFHAMMRQAAIVAGRSATDATTLADSVFAAMHHANLNADGSEKPAAEFFKSFGLDQLSADAQPLFRKVLSHMFFETTDKPTESRLSAFVRNSGLDKALGDDAPGFGAMFDNVGGRWTADLHMMTFLAYHQLDAEVYWAARREQIAKIREGAHVANRIGHRIVDEGITDIALVVPEALFWFGKSNEQNFNESLWQKGFANLVTISESLWPAQRRVYENAPTHLVINLSAVAIDAPAFKVERLGPVELIHDPKKLMLLYADLFSTFYGITNTVGTRLIARALTAAGFDAAQTAAANWSDLNDPRTKIVQENLFLRQPYVELGKGLVDKRFQLLQAEERKSAGAIGRALAASQQAAQESRVLAMDKSYSANAKDASTLAALLQKASETARGAKRKFVPFLYLEGDKFQQLRKQLVSEGVEWVLQGTGDQHISYQQVLAQPQKYYVLFVSFVPEPGDEIPGLPAIGFAKAHLDRVSPHLLRDYFAEASYQALTSLRATEGGQGVFIRLLDTEAERTRFATAAQSAFAVRAF